MRLCIEPCEEYPLHELDVADWLAKEKRYDSQLKGTISIIYVTEDAYCIDVMITDTDKHHYFRRRHWLPRSQCKIVERTGPKK
jgi:hypothetical protein